MITENRRIGEMFQKKREELHLSLKEVENSTSIRMGYLQAIEEGKINEFISGVYALGFTKQYATFLGFNVEQLKKQSPEAFQKRSENHDFSFGIGTLETRGNHRARSKWLPNLLWASATAAFFLLAYWFFKLVGLL